MESFNFNAPLSPSTTPSHSPLHSIGLPNYTFPPSPDSSQPSVKRLRLDGAESNLHDYSMGYLDSSPMSLAGPVTQDNSPVQAINMKKRKVVDEGSVGVNAGVNALGLDYNNKENDIDYGFSSYFYPNHDSTASLNFAYPNWWMPTTTATTPLPTQATTPRAYNNSWYLLNDAEEVGDLSEADRRSSTSSSFSASSTSSYAESPNVLTSPVSEVHDPFLKAMQQSPISIPESNTMSVGLRHSQSQSQCVAKASSPTKSDQPRKRGKLPKQVTETLRKWLMEHAGYPYPTEDEKKMLCSVTGLTLTQTSNWFINARRRILVPAPMSGGHSRKKSASASNATYSAQQLHADAKTQEDLGAGAGADAGAAAAAAETTAQATAHALAQRNQASQHTPESPPPLHSDYHQMYNQQYQKLTQA
ncbi:Homeobox protein PKNOX1 [Wallemia ichthyophaga EXF-994]|uniref:Homeobox protein PKNOX1 n=1 Tax=Wallemia ichthyophaga (strain EXF-994 / CBS 113033) TaxID=1299270 RepID=R9ABG2_WALI9|nr:Homeobox protein PKNOX1 [Wallemia ichthyophaga EXF-994]EOQ99399.1 Homeobox protein PKNOX1 [Wallemia ichthyophaga EXF-994]